MQHEWKNIHFKFEELEKLRHNLPRIYEHTLLVFYYLLKVLRPDVLKIILVAHADWQDIHEISEKCEEAISKLNQAYNMFDPLFIAKMKLMIKRYRGND